MHAQTPLRLLGALWTLGAAIAVYLLVWEFAHDRLSANAELAAGIGASAVVIVPLLVEARLTRGRTVRRRAIVMLVMNVLVVLLIAAGTGGVRPPLQ